VVLSSGTFLFPLRPTLRMQSPFGMTRPSWFSEAARRANLEEAGHESNMLKEGNDMTMRFDTKKWEESKNGLPTQCCGDPF
jgi:hypothetical protein